MSIDKLTELQIEDLIVVIENHKRERTLIDRNTEAAERRVRLDDLKIKWYEKVIWFGFGAAVLAGITGNGIEPFFNGIGHVVNLTGDAVTQVIEAFARLIDDPKS